MHVNKHLATKPKPHLFPHGEGTGAPLPVRIKLRPTRHVLVEKLHVRKVRAGQRRRQARVHERNVAAWNAAHPAA